MTTVNVKSSKLKNIFGTTCPKNQIFTNLTGLHKQSSGDGNIISCNDLFFCVPWSSGSGSVLVYSRKSPIKVPTDPPVVTGHKDLIVDTQFSPFKSTLLATASNDATVRLWEIPEEGLVKNLSKETALLQHDKKINLIQFHPTVENVLLSSSLDFKMRLWDINSPNKAIREIDGHTDLVQSFSWNLEGGAFVSSCRDGFARVYDPRTKTLLVSGAAHDSTKGFKTIWLAKREQFFTVGFNKSQGREFALWDMRKGLKKGCIVRQVVDNFPTHAYLNYDFGNQLLYVAGKADTNIKLYEVTDDQPFINFLSEFKSKESQTGIAMLPQRFNNVYENEIGSFMKLTGRSEVETISFTVPRKDIQIGEKKTKGLEKKPSMQKLKTDSPVVFQEDLFPDVPSGIPSLSLEQWLKGYDKTPTLVSQKKENMVSIYELPVEDGGKLKPMEEVIYGSFSGYLLKVSSDDWKKRDRFYVQLKHQELSFSKNEKSEVTEKIPFSHISSIHLTTGINDDSNNPEDENCWFQISTFDRIFYFICENQNDRIKWIEVLRKHIHRFHEEKPMEDYFFFSNTQNNKLQGWNKRFIHMTQKGLLFFQTKKQSIPKTKLDFSDISSIQDASDVKGLLEDEMKLSLQLNTKKNEKILIQAQNESQKDYWFEYIQNILNPYSDTDNLLVSLGFQRDEKKKSKNQPIMHPKISISPISTNLNEGDIKELLEVFGKIDNVVIHRGGTPFKQDTAIVSFIKEESVQNAITLNGSTLDNLKVKIAPYIEKESINPLYIKVENVPKDISYLDLNGVFTAFGEIDHMKKWLQESASIVYIKYKNKGESKNVLHLNNVKLYGLNIKVTEMNEKVSDDQLFMNELNPQDVKTGKIPVLIQMKGKKRIRSRKVKWGAQQLNSSDVFIIDCGLKIYQWNGKKASKFKKARGLDVTTNLRVKERAGAAKAFILDEGKDEDTNEYKELWNILGNPQNIPLTDNKSDENEEILIDRNTTLYRLSEQQGNFKVKRIATNQNLSKFMLKSEYVYILDCLSEIFIWEGSKSTQSLKKMGKRIAMKLEENDKRPEWTTTTREIELGETVMFKEKFIDFPSLLPISVSASDLQPKVSSTSQKLVQKPIKAEDLIQLKDTNQEELYDDGSGEPTIWKVEGFDKVVYPKNMYGQFYSGDSYIIAYKYKKQMSNNFKHLIYFWQGRDCSVNEKGASALLSVDVSDSQEGEALQIRILQQKETKHFLSIFKNFIIHLGKYNQKNPSQIIDIRESNVGILRAVGFNSDDNFTNSNGVLLRLGNDKSNVWIGKNATKEEIKYAKELSKSLSKNQIQETNEKDSKITRKKTRLFQFTGKTGVVEYSEIYDYSQDSLEDKDVFLLDADENMYLWFGTQAPFFVRKMSIEIALEYSKIQSQKLWVVRSCNEPDEFKVLFQAWGKIKFKNINIQESSEKKIDAEELLKDYSRKTYSYNELLSDKLPEGLDQTKLETYLSDDEFYEIFKMSRTEFNKLAGYKQQDLKKKVYLF